MHQSLSDTEIDGFDYHHHHHLQLLTVYSGTLALATAVSFTDFDVGWGTAMHNNKIVYSLSRSTCMEHDQLYKNEKNMDTFNQKFVNVKECEREKKG